MHLLWSFVVVLCTLHFSTADQLCIDSCQFDHSFDGNFTIPSNCTTVRRNKCDVIVTFDYTNRVVNFQFGTLAKRKRAEDNDDYLTDNIAHTVIGLDEDSSTEHTIEYYCSTGDLCERKYVLNQALPLYLHKTCHLLRAKLIALLHADPSVTTRPCLIQDGEEVICDKQCELFYASPDMIKRDCDDQRRLELQTTVGQSTPTNKPEYNYRLFAYACTTVACNGYATQERVQTLLHQDDGECLIILNNNTETTTTTIAPGTTPSSTTKLSFDLFALIFIVFILKNFR